MSIGCKLLITGLPNTGKTSLLKTLKNALVVSRDGKPFSLPMPHYNVPDYDSVDEFLDVLDQKLDAYEKKSGSMPETIAFDSVSRILTDLEINCSKKDKGFAVWTMLNKEITNFLNNITIIQNNGINVVLIAHTIWDENARRYIETCKGSFQKIGGFLSTTDYALNIDIVGNKRFITHRGNSLSRTLIEDMPDKEDATKFNLQNYIEKIRQRTVAAQEEWSI